MRHFLPESARDFRQFFRSLSLSHSHSLLEGSREWKHFIKKDLRSTAKGRLGIRLERFVFIFFCFFFYLGF